MLLFTYQMGKGLKDANTHCWWGYRKSARSLTAGGNLILVQPFWRAIWQDLQKSKICKPFDLTLPHLEIYSKEIMRQTHKMSVQSDLSWSCLLQKTGSNLNIQEIILDKWFNVLNSRTLQTMIDQMPTSHCFVWQWASVAVSMTHCNYLRKVLGYFDFSVYSYHYSRIMSFQMKM